MPGLSRPHVHALLGLPFDLLSVQQTCDQIRKAIATRRRLFLTTPNVNFVAACVNNAPFRNSVIDSHCVVVDGMPLVWLGRWLGLPVPERVAGSSVFEQLQNTTPQPGQLPIRVYFFGGPPDAARMAAERINANPVGMVCVGHASPGFGSIETMSTPEILDAINASQADFLVVSLGAAKGQAWIQHNRKRLNTPVISHLGAVVNFSAQMLQRAPAFWQRAGLEWLWRIKEEPTLWRRYVSDAQVLLQLMVTRVLPAKWHVLTHAYVYSAAGPADVRVDRANDRAVLHLIGLWNQHTLPKLEACLQGLHSDLLCLELNLSKVIAVDSAFLGGLLHILHCRRALGLGLRVVAANPKVRRQMHWYGVDYLLTAP
ncbi:MAG: WecB/TagA/CpsF family glycosyltransferase [Rhodoferax sp.]|nr:WecB/TagA/CpsF family glycosyltransferase [Rhodoferax sp.]